VVILLLPPHKYRRSFTQKYRQPYRAVCGQTSKSARNNTDSVKPGQKVLKRVQDSVLAPIVDYDRQFLRHSADSQVISA
jgi:hypothetical protein